MKESIGDYSKEKFASNFIIIKNRDTIEIVININCSLLNLIATMLLFSSLPMYRYLQIVPSLYH